MTLLIPCTRIGLSQIWITSCIRDFQLAITPRRVRTLFPHPPCGFTIAQAVHKVKFANKCLQCIGFQSLASIRTPKALLSHSHVQISLRLPSVCRPMIEDPRPSVQNSVYCHPYHKVAREAPKGGQSGCP